MLTDNKISAVERNQLYVKSVEGERLTGTLVENKNVFDKFPQLIMDKYNALVDLLVTLGLDNIVTDLGARYTKTETDTLVEVETQSLVADVFVDINTGIIKITKKDGTFTEVDTALEKVPALFEFIVEDDRAYIKVTNVDGTSTQTEVTNLLNIFVFNDSTDIDFTTTGEGNVKSVTAVIKDNSVTMAKLDIPAKAYFEDAIAQVEADKQAVTTMKASVEDTYSGAVLAQQGAETAEDNATGYATEARSYAKGGTGTRVGEDTDNAQYYKNKAEEYRDSAYQYMTSAQSAAAVAVGFDFQGDWSPSVAYETNQIVSYDNSLWVAIRNNLNALPYMNSPDWKVFIGIPSILDLGDFTETLEGHAIDIYAHDRATFDANNGASTTQGTLSEHMVAEDAHGNIVIDGGGQ